MENFDGPTLQPNNSQSSGEKKSEIPNSKQSSKSYAVYIVIGIVALFFVAIVAFAGYAVYFTIQKNIFPSDKNIPLPDETPITSQPSNIESAQIGSKDNDIYNTAYTIKTALETYYTINSFYPPDNHVEYLWSGNRTVIDGALSLPEECGDFNDPSDECGVSYLTTDEGEGYLINITYLAKPDEGIKGGFQLDGSRHSNTELSDEDVNVSDENEIAYSNVEDGITEVAGFEFPFVVNVEDLNNSTMSNGKGVVIEDPKKEWNKAIYDSNIANGWQLLQEDLYTDGGSSKQTYFFAKKEPMVEIFNEWDMVEGKMVTMTIKLIHPADVAKTLIDIRSQKAVMMEIFNIEELLDCPGSVGEYQSGAYACIGLDGEVVEWY